MSLRVLGGFALTVDGQELAVGSERHRLLLTFLALRGGRAGRAAVLRAVWPDEEEGGARKRLSEATSRLRRGLGSERLLADGDDLLLAGPIDVDAIRFEAEVRAAREADDPTERERSWARAEALHQGELLPGVWVDWVVERREELVELLREALEGLCERHRQTGRPTEALRLARRLVRIAPWSEPAHRQLMAALGLLGRRAEAIAHFGELRERLERELGLAPEPETLALVRRLRQTDPAPRTRPERWPLVGREQELDRLVGALDQAARGAVVTVLVEGAPGMGKSRLLHACEPAATLRGMRWLLADAGAVGSRPYGVVASLLASGLDPVSVEGVRRAVDPAWIAAAAEVVPELRPIAPGPAAALEPEDERRRRQEALRLVVEALATTSPLALVVDDAHRMDHASLEVLGAPTRGAIARLFAFRPLEGREGGLLEGLRGLRGNAIDRLSLGPLAPDDVARLAEATLGEPDEELVRALVERAGGHPLFVVAWARHGDATEVPAALDAIVRSGLEALPADARGLLLAAAVLGGARPLERIAAVAGVGAPVEVAAGLREGGWLVAEGPGLRVSHALVADVVSASASAEQRTAQHRRALDGATDPAEVARHLEALGDRTGMAEAAVIAAEEALRAGAPRDALERLELALDVLDAPADPGGWRLRARALAAAARAGAMNGRPDPDRLQEVEAIALRLDDDELGRRARLDRVLAWVEEGRGSDARALAAAVAEEATGRGDATTAWEARLAIARTLNRAGRYEEALAALEGLERADDTRGARAAFETASVLVRLGRYDEALATAERCVALAHAEGARIVEVRALLCAGNAHAEQQRYADADAAYREARLAASAVGYVHGELAARINLANLSQYRDRYEEAIPEYRVAIERGSFHPQLRSAACTNLGAGLEALGRHEEAIEAYQQAAAALPEEENAAGLPFVHEGLAGCYLGTGDLERALHHAELAVEAARRASDPYIVVGALLKVGDVHRLRGEAARGKPALEEALATAEELGLAVRVHEARVLLAEVLAALGDPGSARTVLEPLDGLEGLDLWVLHRRARVLLGLDDPTGHAALAEARDALLGAAAAIDDPELLDAFLVGNEALARAVLRHLGPLPDELPLLDGQTRVRLPRADAPLGRALTEDERVTVIWTPALPSDPATAEGRREQLLRLLDEATAQGAAPTSFDLAEALGVSRRTVLRDVAELRALGREIPLGR
ncbi:MAG: AAA family ATPase [Alphaproteobacteria bacterium]|nr:AAA family ATPase [Alphaproteobacteria bacterium]